MYRQLSDGPASSAPSPALIESGDWRALGPVRRGVARLAVLANSTTIFGVPGHVCGPTMQHVPSGDDVPAELRDVYTAEELAALRRDMESLVEWTACPFVPGICFPVPIVGYLASELVCLYRRQSGMWSLLQRENERLEAQGLRWRLTLRYRMQAQFISVFDLQWMDGPRQKWEAENPHRRQITREPYPARLFFSLDETRQMNHIALVVQQHLRPQQPGQPARDQQQQGQQQERTASNRSPPPMSLLPSAPSPPPEEIDMDTLHRSQGCRPGAVQSQRPAPAHQSMGPSLASVLPVSLAQRCAACGAARVLHTPHAAFFCYHCGSPYLPE